MNGEYIDLEPDDDAECCWACHGEGGYHDCMEDSCPCLYKDGEPQDRNWRECEECGGRGYV